MKISVIIPIYFSQESIVDCLDSLLAQTIDEEFEIICVGDKVEDPSHAIVEEYCKKHVGIVKLYLQEGRGPSGARNLGLSRAKGEYIMFADADDFVEPRLLEKCESALVKYDADFVCVGFDRTSVSGKKFSNEQSVSDVSVVDVTDKNVARLAFVSTAPWGKLFKRELLHDLYFPEHPMSCYEDCIFILSIHPRVRRYVILPDILYHYIVHEVSGITSPSPERTKKFRDDLIDLRSEFVKNGVSEACLRMLDLAVVIHVGISDVHRIAENPETHIRSFCAGVKAYFDENFPGWRKIKLRPYGQMSLRGTAVWGAKQMYRLNVFWIFIKLYNWMIKTLHIDLKW